MANFSFRELDTEKSTLTKLIRDLNYSFANLDQSNIASTTLVLGNDQVTASNIDFGVGSNQVDASDIPSGDSGNYFNSGTVYGQLQELGSKLFQVTTKTSSGAISSSEVGTILCNSTSAINITLPTAVGTLGLRYSITNINTGIASVIPYGSETLQGETTVYLFQHENISIVSNNSNWYKT